MPWIKKESRRPFVPVLDELVPKLTTDDPGNLAYVFYTVVERLWKRKPRWYVGCTLLGVLVGVTLCFFLNNLWPYEKMKLKENGGVE